MKKLFSKLIFSFSLTVFAFVFSSCIQTYNSSSFDATKYGVAQGTDAFQAVHQILVSKCITCHADFAGDAQSLVDAGYVIPDDSLDSSLYNRLQNSDGFGTKNMPVGAPALSTTDLTAIKTWIDTM